MNWQETTEINKYILYLCLHLTSVGVSSGDVGSKPILMVIPPIPIT